MHHGERREEIIEIATALFLENGFSGTSISLVADAAGITKASLYHHFPSKNDMFITCMTQGFETEINFLNEIANDAGKPPTERLRKAILSLYDRITSSSVERLSPLIAQVSYKFPELAQSFYHNFIEPQDIIISTIIKEGIASGEFREINPKLFCHLLFGPIVTLSHSREMLAALDNLDTHFPVEALRDGHVDVMMNWLVKDLKRG